MILATRGDGSRIYDSNALVTVAAKRAQMDHRDVISVPSSAVATKGTQMDQYVAGVVPSALLAGGGGAQVDPGDVIAVPSMTLANTEAEVDPGAVSAVPTVDGVTEAMPGSHGTESMWSFKADGSQ